MNDEQCLRLIKAFVDIRRCLQQFAGEGELTQGEFLVLRRIKIEQDCAKRLSDFRAVRISQFLSMPPPAVSRLFNSLENKGLIVRQINHDNRRSVIVSLTDKGSEALMRAESSVKTRVKHLSNMLPKK